MTDTDTAPRTFRFALVALGKTLGEVQATDAHHAREVYAGRCGFDTWADLCAFVSGASDIRAFPLPPRRR